MFIAILTAIIFPIIVGYFMSVINGTDNLSDYRLNQFKCSEVMQKKLVLI